MAVETLRWQEEELQMLDQRLLPRTVVYLAYKDAKSVAKGIKDMVVRGAPAIGVAAAYGMALEANLVSGHDSDEFNKRMKSAAKVLAKSRPTAVNLSWAIERMERVITTTSRATPRVVADRLLQEAHLIYREDIEIIRKMGAWGARLFPDGSRVLTHCNAGALATAGYGTALGVIRTAVSEGKRIKVFADETRPFLQGARLTAWELTEDGIDTTLIADNMSGHLMKSGEIDAVIVGTDRVAANADVANKIGTYMVAVLAKTHNIPFYVACPISTIDMSLSSGDLIPIEERPDKEITGYGDLNWAPVGIKVRNPAFDVTPASLVTALITERGIVESPNKEKLDALLNERKCRELN